jgi:hypothetical protein
MEKTRNDQHQEDHEKMHQSRAQLIEWIIFNDYGTKDARKSGELPEAIEVCGLPSMIPYTTAQRVFTAPDSTSVEINLMVYAISKEPSREKLPGLGTPPLYAHNII